MVFTKNTRLRFPAPTLANDKNAFLQLFLGISRGLGRFDSKFFFHSNPRGSVNNFEKDYYLKTFSINLENKNNINFDFLNFPFLSKCLKNFYTKRINKSEYSF